MRRLSEASRHPGEPALDTARLEVWLDATLGGKPASVELTPVHGGASNLTFHVVRASRSYCLRRPPLVTNDPSSNNTRREMRLLKALGQTSVPHPRLIAGCEDESVIGVPFALMEWIEGVTGKDPLPEPFATDPAVRRDMAYALIDALAVVSNVDWSAVGLRGFGKPDGFLERQVDRWLGQLARSQVRPLADLDDLAAWLRTHRPQTQRSSLMHGDYQFINVMFACETPTRLAAIVDWESATIGDPMLDLGWVLAGWQDPGETPSYASYIGWHGFPPRAELAARYAVATGLDVSCLPFYMALALFKLAVIMEGWYARFLRGETHHPAHASAERDVPNMLRRAAEFAGI